MNIDSKIAEKVFGWHNNSHWWVDESGKLTMLAYKTIHAIGEVWHPSTDIKQAFEVVEKMRKGFYFELQDKNGSIFCATFENKIKMEEGVGCNKNPAMAICLAALKAVEA